MSNKKKRKTPRISSSIPQPSPPPVSTKPAAPRPNSKAAAQLRAAKRRRHRVFVRIYAGLASLVVLAAVVLAFSANSIAGYNTSATAWKLPPLAGGPKVPLRSFRGTPVVVNFFASWCKVCASELPVFASTASSLRGKIDFVEVNALETGNGLAFANQYHLASSVSSVLTDVGGSQQNGLYQSLGGTGSLPITAFYTSSGQLITTHIGGYDSQTLLAALKQYYPNQV